MRLVRRLNVSRILPYVIPELIEENVKSSSLAKWKRSGCVVTEQLPRPSLKIELWIYRCDVRLPCLLIDPLDKKLSSTMSHVPWKRGSRYFQRQDNRFNQVNKWAAGT